LAFSIAALISLIFSCTHTRAGRVSERRRRASRVARSARYRVRKDDLEWIRGTQLALGVVQQRDRTVSRDHLHTRRLHFPQLVLKEL
jgi:hypothetical protein